MATERSALVIQKQLKQLSEKPVEGFTVGLVDESNIYKWNVTVVGPPDTLYSGGLFKAKMSFPANYPACPPTFKFTPGMWHPNVDLDGTVCISLLLHSISNDRPSSSCEYWSPNHTVESVFLSIISMLSTPSDDYPANYSAAIQWHMDRVAFVGKVKESLKKSQEVEEKEKKQ